MAEKTRAELNAQADIIKNETQTGQNTAVRVGVMLNDIIDSATNQEDDQVPERLPVLDPDNDAWETAPTAAGHTVDIGRELYETCVNQSGVAVTELEPKVFVMGKSNDLQPKFLDSVLATNTDLANGSLFGLNTTAMDIDGSGDVVVWGRLNGIKTDQWPQGAILWASETAGEMTLTPPSTKAFMVARVERSHPTDGILFSIAARSNEINFEGVALGTQRIWFTGDEVTTPEGTFYLAQPEIGAVASVTQQVIVDDNQLDWFVQDVVGSVTVIDDTIVEGIYEGVLDIMSSSSSAFTRMTLEYYLADADGVVVDSGSGLPNGSYGVPPIMVALSPVIDTPSNTTVFAFVSGRVDADLTIPANHRVRVRVAGEKVGTQGAAKTISLNYGNTHLSFLDTPQSVGLNDLTDVDVGLAVEGDIIRKGSDGIWRPLSGNVDSSKQLPSLADVAAYSNLTTGDFLVWNGSFWENQPAVPSSGIQTADGLTENKTFPANTARTYQVLTVAEYDGIGTKDSNTLYFLVSS